MADSVWSLEVVRGREVGRLYALNGGAVVLGNAPDGAPGLDLSGQEGDSPRKMAARQAQVDLTPQGLTLRDLDSPGGTFVNRQRLLPGQARALRSGDLIQLGSVQLKVVAGGPARPTAPPRPSAPSTPPAPARPSVPPAPPKTGPLATAFTLKAGATCRTWDDFLTVSAQRWTAMRDELTSGRLAAFFATNGRADLAPSAQSPGTPDERLDDWLGSLPTTRPSRPELDVHPETLTVRATGGGGWTRQSVRITNTGYRLLRSTARVEPAGTRWIRVAAGPIVTVEQTDLAIEVESPEILVSPLSAALIIEGNGGTRRVEVRVERPPAPQVIPEGRSAPPSGEGLSERIARQPLPARIATWAAAAAAIRLLIVIGDVLIRGGGSGGEARPGLLGAALLLALVGGALAALLASLRGASRDVPPSACAGGCAGVLLAAVTVATCRAVEPLLGATLSASSAAVVLLWAALGAGLAALSGLLIPPQAGIKGK